MKVAKQFWADVVSTIYFLINHMPSFVLNGDISFAILFPSKSLFLMELHIFDSTYFVGDVRPQVTKLDPKSLKLSFLDFHEFRKVIGVSLSPLIITLCL